MEKIILKGRPVVGGVVEGEALVSTDALVWSHGVHPPTGKINDVRVKLNGTCVKDSILVYPYGKGSTSTSTWMLETFRYGNGPRAILNIETEGLIAIGSILADTLYSIKCPIVDRFDKNPLEVIETGDFVRVDGDHGIVEVIKKK
ncbi:MAG: aconitase X swivel domain-containing protein [Sporomusa sp.]